MDPLRQNGPFNYGTHWGITPYARLRGGGVHPYWNPYHGSMGFSGLGDGTTPAPDDLGSTSVLHILIAAGIGGAVAGFASWDVSRAVTGAAALAGLAAGYDGVSGMTNGKPALGMALLAVGVLGIFASYTSARSWNHRHVRRGASATG